MVWLITMSVFAADRLTKYVAKGYLRPRGSLPVINGIFHLTYVENRGVAFGMLQNKGWVFIPVTLGIILGIVYLLSKAKKGSRMLRLPMAMILGGAIGNLYDRIFLGYVVDFLDFRIWPVFNLADSSIVIGAVLLGYFIAFKGEALGN
ncbi:MAG: Lipoprotein signal peptidase [Firmicutes bacterium]|nr:Lipoprotein signal peptidase [Bacillota bacterium]MDI6705461.1 signal peptidase II [Bacillota bacterium]